MNDILKPLAVFFLILCFPFGFYSIYLPAYTQKRRVGGSIMSDALASAEKLIFLPLYFFGKAFTLYVRPRREILDNFDIKSEDGYSRLHACLGPPVWMPDESYASVGNQCRMS